MNPKLPLSVIAEKLGKPVATVRSAANRPNTFTVEMLGNQRVADLEEARSYFQTAKVGKRAKK